MRVFVYITYKTQ